jgi:hypothetical protein
MTPSHMGSELSRQHAELRQMIEAAREVARRAPEEESLRRKLQADTLQLAEALSAHNQYEEELLRAVTVSGWARADPESMNQHHFEEHKALHAALVEVSVDPNVKWVAGHLAVALDRIVEHMAQEESTFLDQGFLPNDEPDTEPYGSPAPGT